MQDENLNTKQIKSILSGEIKNWIIWGSKKDWKPVGFRCPTGFRYIQPLGDVYDSSFKPPHCDELEAVEFERIIVHMPEKHRQAFVLYHLNRANIGVRVVQVKDRNRKAELLGVQRAMYFRIVNQAHNILWREWNRVKKM